MSTASPKSHIYLFLKGWMKIKAVNLVPALVVVLTRQRLWLAHQIPGMDMKVEELITLGLFRWKEDTPAAIGYLECPYIFLWLLATWSQNPILSHYKLDAYNKQQSQTNPSIPLGHRCGKIGKR